MASTRHTRRSHPRALRAVLLSLVAALLSGAFVGLATADDPAGAGTSGTDATFGVPDPHRDDTAHYTLHTEVRGPHGPVDVSEEEDHVRHWWTGPTFRYDADGQPRELERLAVIAYGEEPEDPRLGQIPRLYGFDRATWEPVTVEETYTHAYARDSLASPIDEEERTREGLVVGYQHTATFVYLPCGPLNALQGATVPSDETLALFAPCSLPGVDGPIDGMFAHLGTSVHDGHTYAWYTRAANATQPEITVTFRADLPYPVRIEAGPYDGDRFSILRLDAFHRGQQPIGGAPSDLPPLAAGAITPSTDWVIDDRQGWADHPFRLQQAYTWALGGDAALQRFLQTYPDAYLHAATLREHEAATEHLWTWQLRFGIGEEIHLSCPQRVVLAHDGWTVRDEVVLADECRDFVRTSVPPAPPTHAPDLRGMLEAYANRQSMMDAEANSYGFEWTCTDTSCTDARLTTRVGRHYVSGDDLAPTKPDGALPGTERSFEYTWLSFTSDARVEMAFVDKDLPSDPLAPTAQMQEEPSLLTFGHTPVSPWRLPTSTEAAGIGLFALLLGIVYWFWPTLKQGLFSTLFSRIDRPKALAHEERARIATLVEAEPGIHGREIVRRSGLSRGAVRHHLDKLVATGILITTQNHGYRCYHPAGTDRRSADAAPALRAPTAQALAAHLASHPGSSLTETARALGVSKQALARHVDRLEAAGILVRRRDGRSIRLEMRNLGETDRPQSAQPVASADLT